ncbi:MAG TPA: BTB/POZ domain-containing protein [Myxococcota bacterium]|nr:BTB/POZ domain-containing protein [Myxococcota bacterium]
MGARLALFSVLATTLLAARLVSGAESMLGRFGKFRESGDFSDVVLVSCDGEGKHQAHQMVLAARGDYWKKMFTDKWKESASKEVKLNYTSEAIKSYLDFIYKAKKSFDEVLTCRVYQDLIELSDLSMDQELQAALGEAAVTFDEMCGDALNFAILHQDRHLQAQIFAFLNTDGVSGKLFKPIELFTLKGHKGCIWEVNFSPDGSLIVTGSWDKTVKIWQAKDGALVHSLPGHTDIIYSASFSKDGKSVITGSGDKTVKIWSVENGGVTRTIGATHKIISASFGDDDQFIIAAFGDKTAKIWNTRTEQWTHILTGHEKVILYASFGRGNKLQATASGDGNVRLFHIREGHPEMLRILSGHAARTNSVQFSPDAKTIASASDDGSVKIWNVHDGSLEKTLTDTGEVNFAAFSPNGKWLASGSQNCARLWKIKNGELAYVLDGLTGKVRHVSFSPSGDLIAAAFHRLAKVWLLPPLQLADDTGSAHTLRLLMRLYLKSTIPDKRSYDSFKNFILEENPTFQALVPKIGGLETKRYLEAFLKT